ncbi:hypothetical protein [Siphonobacter sp. SORGH_AS_1065]|uniref:hypothetical protein n=1 Tax=Siphonobacter sp. SORGH_AS_1065 TaxID=3041795 RepID=UPI00278322D1|nr:hypothetical protein [Siphonobacter sp. SORGH_AS_1065]MDQ1088685.1 hypothetical protein [Siphonobacter sp. SORGH_AS_1065]
MLKILTTTLVLLTSTFTFAQTTKVIVRAQAKDAKFIGTGIGGAYVIIRNELTGEILAKGLTSGNSGNTDLLMNQPYKRHNRLTDDQTARFEADLKLDAPTFVTVEAIAPVNRKSSAVKASTQLWLIPGKPIDGDGIILQIPGLMVDILEPQSHQVITQTTLKDNQVKIRINLVMMCGCVINKNGFWKSDNIEVKALVKKDGMKFGEIPLSFASQDNIFEGMLSVKDKGMYEIQIYAYDQVNKNTGIDRINFVIQ